MAQHQEVHMTSGSIAVIVIGFSWNQFDGAVIPECGKVVESGTLLLS